MLPLIWPNWPSEVGVLTCYEHPGMSAAASCANCGKEICAACITHVGDKTVCRNCAETLRSQPVPPADEPAPEIPEVTEAPQASPSPVAPEAPMPPPAPSPAPAPALAPVEERSGVPATLTPSSITPTPQPRPPSVPDLGTGGQREKESLLSAALSLLLPGAGQAYNGQIAKGIILAALYLGSVGIIIGGAVITTMMSGANSSSRSACCCCLPLFIVPLVLLVYAIYDAYNTAEYINNGQAVRDWL